MLRFDGRTTPHPAGNSTSATIELTKTGLLVSGGAATGTQAIQFVADASFVLHAPSRTILNQGAAWFDENPWIITGEEPAVVAGYAEGQMLVRIRVSEAFRDSEGPVQTSAATGVAAARPWMPAY